MINLSYITTSVNSFYQSYTKRVNLFVDVKVAVQNFTIDNSQTEAAVENVLICLKTECEFSQSLFSANLKKPFCYHIG